LVEQLLKRVHIGAKQLNRSILSRSFVRNVGILTIANGVGAVLSFVQGFLVARWLGPELYGVAALVMSVPSLVYTFFDARSVEASVKFLSEFDTRGEQERALAMCKAGYAVDFAVAGLALLVVLLLAPWAAKSVVHHPDMAWLIILYGSAFFPRALVGTSYAVLATLERFPTIAFINTLTNVVRVGVVLGLVGLGWRVVGVVLGNAIAMVATGLLYGALAYGLAKNRWGRSWLFADWRHLKGRRKEILAFLAFNDLNALLGMIPKQLDVVILGYFRNPTDVGFYKLAKNLAASMGYIVGPLQSVVYPNLSKLLAISNSTFFHNRIRQLAYRVGLPLGLSALVGALFVPWFIPLLFGQEYRPAIFLTQMLLVGCGVWLAFFWLRPAYMAKGCIRQWTSGIALYTVTFTVLSIACVPAWGAKGASLAQVITTTFFHFYMGWHLYASSRNSRKSV